MPNIPTQYLPSQFWEPLITSIWKTVIWGQLKPKGWHFGSKIKLLVDPPSTTHVEWSLRPELGWKEDSTRPKESPKVIAQKLVLETNIWAWCQPLSHFHLPSHLPGRKKNSSEGVEGFVTEKGYWLAGPPPRTWLKRDIHIALSFLCRITLHLNLSYHGIS